MTAVNFAPTFCPEPQSLARAKFTTLRLRLRLNKIGARIVETASRVRVAVAAARFCQRSRQPVWSAKIGLR